MLRCRNEGSRVGGAARAEFCDFKSAGWPAVLKVAVNSPTALRVRSEVLGIVKDYLTVDAEEDVVGVTALRTESLRLFASFRAPPDSRLLASCANATATQSMFKTSIGLQ